MIRFVSAPRGAAPLLVLSCAALLSACAVGPDFERPPPPTIKGYESTPLPEKTESVSLETKAASVNTESNTNQAPTPPPEPVEGGNAQSFKEGQDIPAEWWVLFHSQPLNQLVALSLKTNPDIEAAEAALREAHENTAAGTGVLLPQIDAGFSATREKTSGAAFGSSTNIPPFSVYTASVSVSYGLDIFGGERREIEALGAAEDFQKYELEAARITLTANVVTAAIQEASLRAQIEATKKIIEEDKKQLDLLNNQFQLGGISKSSVLQQQTQLAQARATLPPLENQLAQTRHLLSVLAGQFPSREPAATFLLANLTLPGELPVSLPSKLVEQRPDIRAAEATLHAASAEIGVATANMLPQITLTGDIGSTAATIGSLFAPGAGIWSIAGGLVQPLFHGGELLHKKRASEAAYDQAAAQYRKTVLTAFQNVADTLHALQSDAETLKASAEAERAARDSLNLTSQQYKDGAISYLGLLTAEQAEQQARLALVQAEARRYSDTAALFVALGGGWWNRVDAADDNVTATTDEGKAPTVQTNFNHAQED